MKSITSTLALAAVLALFGTNSADAQSIGSVGDYYNDYELYTAEWQTNWYSIVTWSDGTETEYRSYSEESAYSWALWMHLHLSNVADIDIISREELSQWEYVDTFGTYKLAVSEAGDWEQDGFVTDIRSVRVNWTWANRYRPIIGRLIMKK